MGFWGTLLHHYAFASSIWWRKTIHMITIERVIPLQLKKKEKKGLRCFAQWWRPHVGQVEVMNCGFVCLRYLIKYSLSFVKTQGTVTERRTITQLEYQIQKLAEQEAVGGITTHDTLLSQCSTRLEHNLTTFQTNRPCTSFVTVSAVC